MWVEMCSHSSPNEIPSSFHSLYFSFLPSATVFAFSPFRVTYLTITSLHLFSLVLKRLVDSHRSIDNVTLDTHSRTNNESIVSVPQWHGCQRLLKLLHINRFITMEAESQGLVRQEHHRIVRPIAALVCFNHHVSSNSLRCDGDITL